MQYCGHKYLFLGDIVENIVECHVYIILASLGRVRWNLREILISYSKL
jgi:hypothetical protein